MLAPPLRRSTAATSSMPNIHSKPQRPIPPQRRSTLKRSIDDTNIMQTPSSPSKRSRVTFDSDVEIVSADDDDDELDPLVVREQIRRAVERHKHGEDESYNKIRAVFNTSPQERDAPSLKALKSHLQALIANVAILSKECSALVNDTLSSEWIGRDDAYYSLFVRFLTNLAAAQRGYQHQIMQMLVNLLGPQKTKRLQDSKPVSQKRIHTRTLSAIRHIAINVPSATAALVDGVGNKLEFEFAKAEERTTYTKSFMKMMQYVPELAPEILQCILREVMKLDVNIQLRFDQVEDPAAEEELIHHISLSSETRTESEPWNIGRPEEVEDDNSTLAGSETTEEDDDELLDETSEQAELRKLQEDVRQVDQIMEILFCHYDSLMSSANLRIRDNAIEQLLAYFEHHILPSHRSRHPQFLLFHFFQSDPILIDRFVALCVGKLLDKRQLPLIRHSAAAYLAGFLGRGANVPKHTIATSFNLLCTDLDTLRRAYESKATGPDVKRFGDFYATFQAAIYIFCLRWRTLAEDSEDAEDEEDIFGNTSVEQHHFSDDMIDKFRNAVYSTLNPLRVCSKNIVHVFADLMLRHNLLYLHSKMEENKHVRVTTHWRSLSDLTLNDASRDLTWMGEDGMLEEWFPFDPYHLPISKRWVVADYVTWEASQGDDKPEDDSEDEDHAMFMVRQADVDEDDLDDM